MSNFFEEELIMDEEFGGNGFGGNRYGSYGSPMNNRTQLLPDIDGGFAMGPMDGIGFDPLDGDLTLDIDGIAFDL